MERPRNITMGRNSIYEEKLCIDGKGAGWKEFERMQGSEETRKEITD